MEGNLISIKKEDGNFICEKIKLATTIDERMIGLMFKENLEGYDGLLIRPCNSIHTFFMKMSIDALFLDKNYKVVKVFYDLRPWRITGMYFKAHQVLEMKAGTMPKNLRIGEELRMYV